MSDFNNDLKTGKIGELTLKNLVPSLTQTDGRKFDFLTKSDKSVEVKYDRTKWARKNFFIEIISNDNKNSPGGPYQSAQNSVDYFVYMFSTGAVFVFETSELVKWLDINKNQFEQKIIPNKYYNTIGIAVPVEKLAVMNKGLEVLK